MVQAERSENLYCSSGEFWVIYGGFTTTCGRVICGVFLVFCSEFSVICFEFGGICFELGEICDGFGVICGDFGIIRGEFEVKFDAFGVFCLVVFRSIKNTILSIFIF